jgi:hyperosmotically inducible periplasmic protein
MVVEAVSDTEGAMFTRKRRAATVAGLIGGAALALSVPATALGDDAPPDAWLTTKAKLAVLSDVGTDGTDVNVDTVRGVVTLHGTVASEADKKTAEEAAKGLDGVKEVRNLLQVVPVKDGEDVAASDDKIRESIEAKLASDTGVKSASIEVQSVNDGTVLLAGEAPDSMTHLRAVEIARSVPGVQKVASEVKTPDAERDADVWKQVSAGTERKDEKGAMEKTGEAVSDAWKGLTGAAKDAYVTTAVKSRLLAEDDTPGMEINVDTEDGVVTLFGTVPSAEAKAKAEREAKKASGVERVVNELEIDAADVSAKKAD